MYILVVFDLWLNIQGHSERYDLQRLQSINTRLFLYQNNRKLCLDFFFSSSITHVCLPYTGPVCGSAILLIDNGFARTP